MASLFVISSYIVSIIFAILASSIFPYAIMSSIVAFVIKIMAWTTIIKLFYRVNAKKGLVLILFYGIASILIAFIVGVIAFALIATLGPLLPHTPNLVKVSCHNYCIELPDYYSYEVVKENKEIYSCYCISETGNSTKVLEFPVNYDWDGLEKNLSTKLRERATKLQNNAWPDFYATAPKFQNMIKDILSENSTRTYSIKEIDYEVQLLAVDLNSSLSKFMVNSGVTNILGQNQSTKLPDGTELGVMKIFLYEGKPAVGFYLGAD